MKSIIIFIMITTTFANDVVESPESRLMTWFSSHGGMTSNLDLVQRDGKYHLIATDFISKGGLLMQVPYEIIISDKTIEDGISEIIS